MDKAQNSKKYWKNVLSHKADDIPTLGGILKEQGSIGRYIGRQWPRWFWEMIRFVGRVRVATACDVISTHTHTSTQAIRPAASLDSRQFIWTIATSPLRYHFPPYRASALYIYLRIVSMWPIDNGDDDVFQSFEHSDRGGGWRLR